MRIVVTGAQGQVGYELLRSLHPLGEVVGLDRGRCDLGRPEALEEVLAGLHPDAIVNAAAYTAVDRAEDEEALATRINGEAVAALAAVARRLGVLLIHYSTDYVFDGRASGAHRPDESPSPCNAYGRSKLAGEQALQASGADYLCLRTSWVYGARGRNFLLTMLRLMAERESLRVVADQTGAPTWSRNIADATALILAQARAERSGGRFRSETLHLSNAGATSWHGFACAILEDGREWLEDFLPRVACIEAISTADYPVPAPRPGNSLLDGSRLQARFGLALPDWRLALRACLEDMGSQTRPWAAASR